MNDRIRAIVGKEWKDLLRNRITLSAMIAMPVLLTLVACAQVILISRVPFGPKDAAKAGELPAHLRALTNDPREATLLLMAYSALLIFSILPAVLPSLLAAHSIVGEKASKSLEPLLATPIRTWELLAGKLFAIVVPAVCPGLGCYAVYALTVWAMASPLIFGFVVSAPFVLSIVLVGPLLSVLGVAFGIMVSSRASDLQSAQSLSGFMVLPVIGIGIAQVFGAVALTLSSVLARAAGLVVVDVALLLLCISIFERETILSRWR